MLNLLIELVETVALCPVAGLIVAVILLGCRAIGKAAGDG